MHGLKSCGSDGLTNTFYLSHPFGHVATFELVSVKQDFMCGNALKYLEM